jgi:hypothetical protein
MEEIRDRDRVVNKLKIKKERNRKIIEKRIKNKHDYDWMK